MVCKSRADEKGGKRKRPETGALGGALVLMTEIRSHREVIERFFYA